MTEPNAIDDLKSAVQKIASGESLADRLRHPEELPRSKRLHRLHTERGSHIGFADDKGYLYTVNCQPSARSKLGTGVHPLLAKDRPNKRHALRRRAADQLGLPNPYAPAAAAS